MTSRQPDLAPGSIIPRVLNSDPDIARAFGVAGLLGQGVILRHARDSGASAAEAQRILASLAASLPKTEPDLTEEEVKALFALLDAVIGHISNRDSVEAEAIKRAVAAYEEQNENPVEMTGWADDVSKVAKTFGLIAALLLGESKLAADIPLPGGGHINITEGVPENLLPILELVGKIVPGLGNAATAHPGKPDDGRTKPPTSPTGEPKSRGHGAPPAPFPTPGKGNPGKPVVDQAEPRWMEYDEAVAIRDAVLQSIYQKQLVAFLADGDAALFVKQQGKDKGDFGARNVRESRPVTFSAGIFRADAGRPRDNRLLYRVGLRLQSFNRLTLKTLQTARDELDDRFPNQVSVRWTSRPVQVASNPDGHSGNWAVSPKGRVLSGAPVNIPGGAVGSWTLVLRDKAKNSFGLTVGHTIWDDDGRGQAGSAVYSPPQGLSVDSKHVFGTVCRTEVFDAFDPQSPTVGSDRRDFALVELPAGRVPLESECRLAGARAFLNSFADPNEVRENRPRLIKASAKTREAVGRLMQTNVRAELLNPMTGVTVVGDGLVEIELDENFSADRGESGALVCTDDGKCVKPYAMVVAAARRACLPTVKAPTRYALYALPLAEISALNELEIW